MEFLEEVSTLTCCFFLEFHRECYNCQKDQRKTEGIQGYEYLKWKFFLQNQAEMNSKEKIT